MSHTRQPCVSTPVFDHHPDGFGISNPRPRLSWKFTVDNSMARGWTQMAYEVSLAQRGGEQQTCRVDSEQSVLVPWPFEPMLSRQRVSIRVRCWGKYETRPDQNHNHDHEEPQPTDWSPSASAEVALLDRGEWSASLITSALRLGPDVPLQPLRFRRQFEIPMCPEGEQLEARLYITALGVFEAYLNGHRLGDECMAPGWTSYNHRLTYRCLDVASFLNKKGSNVLAIEAGEGWYATKLGFRGGTRFLYGGKDIALMAQLELRHENTIWSLVTDESWECSASAIQSSELYNGEVYDLQKEDFGWNTSDNKAASVTSTWSLVRVLPWSAERRLVTTNSPPVRVVESKQVQLVTTSPSGKTIVDFGQNLVGKLKIRSVHLPAGSHLTFRHAEVLEEGELCVRPLNQAKCEDVIIGAGAEIKDWTPKFTFHGFRHVQVDGWPGTEEDLILNLSASVMHSDMQRRGSFTCSNESINQLHNNIVWSMRGNFLSIPTDCPQRDERLGWTGDLQIFCPTASFLYDTVGLLESWLQDLSAEQLEDGHNGVPPYVCPEVPLPTWPPRIPQAIWHDVTVLTPWDLYRFSSDRSLLERQFDSMLAWLEQGVDRGPDRLWKFDRWQLGDWLDPNAPPQSPALALTDKVLVADAYLVHVTGVFASVCHVLVKTDLAAQYCTEAATLKRLFQDKYMTPQGNLMSNTQTAIALAVRFNLYAHPHQLRTAAASVSKLVRTARFHVATGFAGTPEILPALTATAQPQLAYRMLLEPTCPSWMYPLSMGATTVWERWDSMMPDGKVNPGQMTSFNHYALGAVADWLHASVGGLSPLEPGWKVVKVRPVPGGNLTHAQVEFNGPYGVVRCSWSLREAAGSTAGEKQRFEMELQVPGNSTARVTLPCDLKQDAGDGGEESYQVVGSGLHKFSCAYEPGEWPPKVMLPPNMTYSLEMDRVAE